MRDPDGLVLGVLEPGQFTGDVGLLFGQPAFADCIAVEPGEVVLVAPAQIAELVQVDPDVSDVLLPAFAARRLLLMRRQQGTLTLVGREGAPRLQRVLEYAERNRIPYRWLDPADSAQTGEIQAPPKACGPFCSTTWQSAANRRPPHGSKTSSDFPPASRAPTSPSGPSCRPSSSVRG